MRMTSAAVRVLQFIHGSAIVIMFCCCGICAEAQTNSWISPTGGNWEDLTWSLGVRPAAGQDITITNAGWKAIQLTHASAVNFPDSMTVGSITISSPVDTANSLVLNYVGVPSPLTVDNLTLNSNSTMVLLSSALEVHTNLNVTGTFNQGAFSGVSTLALTLGNGGPATYNLSNGTLNVSSLETIGVSGFSTVFNQEGGYHFASDLEVPIYATYTLKGGQLGGQLIGLHGNFIQSSGQITGVALHAAGAMLQTGGSNYCDLAVDSGNYVLSDGILICRSNLAISPTAIFEQDGGSNTINGILDVQNDDSRPGGPVRGTFTLGGGLLLNDGAFIGGIYTQTGGTNQIAGDLTITGNSYSRSTLTGGWLVTSNTYIKDGNGIFTQTGGRHQVSGTLYVAGESGPPYNLDGGELIAPTIEIVDGTLEHRAGTVVNTGVLRLGGWWEEMAGDQQFGQLQMSTNDGSLWLGTNSAIIRFADSGGQVWGSGILHIRNWSGSLSGGGGNQVIFGNNGNGLTPAQVAQIRFDYFPSTEYTAKILPSGEVVPNASGAPHDPSGLDAEGVSAYQINLAWADNSIDETGFNIERSLDGTNFVPLATVPANTTSYSDSGLVPMTAYYYRVRAYNDSGDSSYTPVAEASTKESGTPPLPGMIAWWPAENSADDVIGNHNGTTPYGIAYAPGESGQAFDFDASNRRVFIPDSPDFVLTNLTLEGWLYARQTLDSYIAMRGDDRGALDSWVIRRMSDGQLAFQIGDMMLNFVTIETPVPNNQWTHFAATFDSASGAMKLYINGALAVQTNTTLQLIGAYEPGWNPGIGIGSQSGTLTVRPSFDGLIDDVALYSRPLTPGEIKSIYNAGTTGKAGFSLVQTNAWISNASGNWEDAHWSLGVTPAINQSIFITNSNWKAVQLSANTAQSFPETLLAGTVTVSSPTNTVNTLFLNNVGVASPLSVKSFTLGNNSVLTMLSSALQSTSNFDVGGTVNQGDFSGVTTANLRIGSIGPATYNLTNGTLAALQSEQLGGSNFPAVFNQDGGYHYTAALSIDSGGEYNLRDGQLGGSVNVNGGTLNQTGGDFRQNDFSVTGNYWLSAGTLEASNQIQIQYGTIIQTGGTNTSGLLRIATNTSINFEIAGTYVLSNGVLHVSGVNLGFLGIYEQDGGVCTIDGSISAPAYFVGPNPGHEVAAPVYINGGILSVGGIDTAGGISQSGGTNEVRGNLTFGDWSPASYNLRSGLLTTSNTVFVLNDVGQGFYQSGGRHVVANTLSLIGNNRPYTMDGGELAATEIDIVNGGRFFHRGGVVSNSLLALDSSTWSEGTAAQVFGQLQLDGSSNSASALVFASNSPCVIHFADSSARGWSNGVTLQIQNWNGSLTGGGSQQVIFGNNPAALTPAQLHAIVFNDSGTLYPARILSSGEIVPDMAANTSPILSLQSPSGGAMQLTIDSVSGRTYQVEVSTDLVNWITWTQVDSLGTNCTIVDTNTASCPQRFYRVRVLP